MYDYIIIGQGLAGSLLSYFLLEEKQKILVIDPGGSNASRVAAGMFNPLTGRRMGKSWMVEELLETAGKVYARLEGLLSAKFYHHIPMLRLFPSANERDANLKKLDQSDGRDFIEHCYDHISVEGMQPIQHGACVVKGTGYLDTEVFLTAWQQYLRSNDLLRQDTINYEDIVFIDTLKWKDIEARNIIFCEGYRAAQNPWFVYLPWNLAKGELLTLKIPSLQLDKIINRNMYLVPMGNGLFRLGATYSWDDLSETPTATAREELLQKFEALVSAPYEVIDHQAGVRPTVLNRRPFLGKHKDKPELSIFNGLGTKGVLLAPYFGQQMARHLVHGEELMEEVDISRFE